MAKDDYFVIVFKILTYYYACFKDKIVFNDKVFKSYIDISEGYLNKVLYMMYEEGYINNLVFINAWGNYKILDTKLCDCMITQKGIEYLLDNSKMNKIKEFMLENVKQCCFINKISILIK